MNIKINDALLKQVCLTSIKSFEKIATSTVQTKDGVYYHIDNGSNILAIAHLDSVLDKRHFYRQAYKGTDYIYNAQLDDRLGVYVLLYVLPALGINIDILLTEGEEKGRSTAAHYIPTKDYKWMFSFDRRGEDAVLYQYESEKVCTELENSGFKIGRGTFSDISFADHLGITGINIGTGYEGEHTAKCRVNLQVLDRQVNRFVDFYHRMKDTTLPYVPEIGGFSRRGYYGDEWDDDICYLCMLPPIHPSESTNLGEGLVICDECLSQAGECSSCNDIVYDYELKDGLCRECQYYRDRHLFDF